MQTCNIYTLTQKIVTQLLLYNVIPGDDFHFTVVVVIVVDIVVVIVVVIVVIVVVVVSLEVGVSFK